MLPKHKEIVMCPATRASLLVININHRNAIYAVYIQNQDLSAICVYKIVYIYFSNEFLFQKQFLFCVKGTQFLKHNNSLPSMRKCKNTNTIPKPDPQHMGILFKKPGAFKETPVLFS